MSNCYADSFDIKLYYHIFFRKTEIVLRVYHSLFIYRVKYVIPIWGKASSVKTLFILQKSAKRSIFKLRNKESL